MRHGSSEANITNTWSGWLNVDLHMADAQADFKKGAEALAHEGLTEFDWCFTSDLKRSRESADYLMKDLKKTIKAEVAEAAAEKAAATKAPSALATVTGLIDAVAADKKSDTDSEEKSDSVPAKITPLRTHILATRLLKERHYGALTGMEKRKVSEMYGVDVVRKWRRDYDGKPPPITEEMQELLFTRRVEIDVKEVSAKPACAHASDVIEELEKSVPWHDIKVESLRDVKKRVKIFWNKIFNEVTDLHRGQGTVLCVVHGSTVRAFAKIIDRIGDGKLMQKLEIPNGYALVYRFDETGKVIPQRDAIHPIQKKLLAPLEISGRFIGDMEELARKHDALGKELDKKKEPEAAKPKAAAVAEDKAAV
jgi:bisphosphoglycerate-dependent phosphoglycerate mutase family 1